MTGLSMIWRALFAGWRLQRSETWKDAGAVLGLMFAVLTPVLHYGSVLLASYGWLPHPLTAEEMVSVQAWFMTTAGPVLAYWFRATSTSVGWGSHAPDISTDDSDAPDAAGVLNRADGYRSLQGLPAPSAQDAPGRRSVPGFEDLDRFTGGTN